MNLEAEAVDGLDKSRLQAVQLCHSFDLTETYVVAILEFMSLVLMNSHDHRVSLSGVYNDKWFSMFAISIGDDVLVAVVEEGEAARAEGSREDEADVLCSDELIDLDELINVVENLCVANYVELGMIFKAQLFHYIDLNVRVQLLELLEAGYSARYLPDVLLPGVEVAREVAPCDWGRVVESD